MNPATRFLTFDRELDNSVRCGPPRPWGPSPEHSELVAQDQDLGLLGSVGPGAQHQRGHKLGEDEIDQPQRRRWIMPGLPPAAMQQINSLSRISAPTGELAVPAQDRRRRGEHPVAAWAAGPAAAGTDRAHVVQLGGGCLLGVRAARGGRYIVSARTPRQLR